MAELDKELIRKKRIYQLRVINAAVIVAIIGIVFCAVMGAFLGLVFGFILFGICTISWIVIFIQKLAHKPTNEELEKFGKW